MNWKLLIPIFVLLFISSFAFAYPAGVTPDVNITHPSSGELLTGGTTFNIDFNVVDYNTDLHGGTPPGIKLYYGTTAASYSNLIVYDTNLDSGTGVVCDDTNYLETTRCIYNWTVPSTLTAGTYYIDYNLIDFNATRDAYQGFTGSSNGWTYSLLSASGCGLIQWVAPLFLILLAFFVTMQLLGGKFSQSLVTTAIVGIIGILIVYSITAGICVI